MDVFTAYKEAFEKCYPGKTVKFKAVRGGHKIVIDGDAGDMVLSISDIREATRAFLRGRIK